MVAEQRGRFRISKNVFRNARFVIGFLCVLISFDDTGVKAFDSCTKLLRGQCRPQCDESTSTTLPIRAFLCDGKVSCCVTKSRLIAPRVKATSTTSPTTPASAGQLNLNVVNRAAPLGPRCGEPVHSLVKRVVGGTRVGKCRYPWMVYIKRGPLDIDFCSGTLVSDRHVLTAAHCLTNVANFQMSLTIGQENRSDTDPTYFETTQFDVKIHPGYNRFSYNNDLAVLTLQERILFENYDCVGPICLPEAGQTFSVGSQCTVTGWGSTSRGLNPEPSDNLLRATVGIVSDQHCIKNFRYYFHASTQICAGDLVTAADSCEGDSGGPLMCSRIRDGTGTQFLAGVISSGANPCGQAGVPAIYTDVVAARAWVDEVIGGDFFE